VTVLLGDERNEFPDANRARRLADKCTARLRRGDVVRILTPGGGGFGRRANQPSR